MTDTTQILRQIPKVDELLTHPSMVGVSHTLAKEAVREVLGALRAEILSGECTAMPQTDALMQRVICQMQRKAQPSLRKVINATGVVLHTNLGRAPMSKMALDAIAETATGYCTLEYNVDQGKRGSRHDHVAELLTRLTGAEDAIAVNNNAAAVLLMLSALASDREVVVSRGELVEIGGAFRIPDVMEQSGCTLREVGTTNRTRAADYKAVINEHTGALLKAHTSNYRIVGFTEEVPLEDLVELGKTCHLPVLYDLGSGAMLSSHYLNLYGEPVVKECIDAGVDVVSFSGDKLLGGPQAGMIVGKKEYIAKMKKHPLARALRIDKLTLAALEATLRLYLDPERAMVEIPTLAMLSADVYTVRVKAERLMQKLMPLGEQVQIVDELSQVGGGSVPGETMPSVAIAVVTSKLSADELEKLLRGWSVPIVGRIAKDRLLLDMRTVAEEEIDCIADCLLAVLGG